MNAMSKLGRFALLGGWWCVFSAAWADPNTPWPAELTQYYITQCEHGLRMQGDGPTKARTICGCMASGLSKEFGMEEFDNMRTARLDPMGSFHDRRFHRIVDACYRMYLNPSKRLN
ncbi:MAG: hypothetical protein RLZZ24_1029 [Pseudomonadota bacterium]|jgi:hypothetical protein